MIREQTLCETLLPFGTGDVFEAEDILNKCEITFGDFSEYVDDFCKELEQSLTNLDIVATVYDYIHQQVRNEVDSYLESVLEKSEERLADNDLAVYGNYLNTSYDGDDETTAEAKKLCLLMPEEKRSKMLNWFIEQLD